MRGKEEWETKSTHTVQEAQSWGKGALPGRPPPPAAPLLPLPQGLTLE